MIEDTEVRSMTLLNEMGDIEITWESENDEKVRAIIEKKMREGVRFFILKPVLGDLLHMRRKLTKITDLKANNVKIKDADIETLFSVGDVNLFRSSVPSGSLETSGVASVKGKDGNPDYYESSKKAVANRTVGVKALQGG